MSVFRFKQFAVNQSGCAMKINTDGVLLGAMATTVPRGRILDVGTGTGVIALMLAQRCPSVRIDALEIDAEAAETARRNFAESPFRERLTAYAAGLGAFEPDGVYDLIVSNPPFFLDSLRNDDVRKGMARHTDFHFFDELLARAQRWLTPTGRLEVILPLPLADRVVGKAASNHGLVLQSSVTVRSFPSGQPIRRVLFLGREPAPGVKTDIGFVIYERRGVYSEAYRRLLQPFFLAF